MEQCQYYIQHRIKDLERNETTTNVHSKYECQNALSSCEQWFNMTRFIPVQTWTTDFHGTDYFHLKRIAKNGKVSKISLRVSDLPELIFPMIKAYLVLSSQDVEDIKEIFTKLWERLPHGYECGDFYDEAGYRILNSTKFECRTSTFDFHTYFFFKIILPTKAFRSYSIRIDHIPEIMKRMIDAVCKNPSSEFEKYDLVALCEISRPLIERCEKEGWEFKIQGEDW